MGTREDIPPARRRRDRRAGAARGGSPRPKPKPRRSRRRPSVSTTAEPAPEAPGTPPALRSTLGDGARRSAAGAGTAVPELERRNEAGRPPSPPKAQAPAEAAGGTPAQPRASHKAVAPSALTPSLPLALRGSIAGVPSFFIENFEIPPFLLPIFQAAGAAYGIPWQVLAAINEVETDYGRDLSTSSAGRRGLDAVPARIVGAVRRRRQRRRLQGPVQPRRRDLRGRALPARGRRRAEHPRRGLLLQPLAGLRQLGDAARTAARVARPPNSSGRSRA